MRAPPRTHAHRDHGAGNHNKSLLLLKGNLSSKSSLTPQSFHGRTCQPSFSTDTNTRSHTHNQTHTETSVSCLSSHWNHLENNPCFSGKCLHRGLLVMAVESTSCGFVFVPYTHIRTHAHTNTFSLGCICTRS